MLKTIKYVLLIFTVTAVTACDSYLDVKPWDSIGENELLSSEQGYRKLLNGVYLEMNSEDLYGKAMTTEMIEVMANDCSVGTNTNTWGDYVDLYEHRYTTTNWRSRFDKVWDKSYNLVMNCNKILDNIDANSGLFTEKHFRMIKGEALALRAFLQFDMLRLFGPVYMRDSTSAAIPYRLKQTLGADDPLPANRVIEYVIADLDSAKALLSGIDPILTDGPQMSADPGGDNFERYRPLRFNYYAVEAMLARVWLYRSNGNTDAAGKMAYGYAQRVIEDGAQTFPFVSKNVVLGSPTNPDRVFSSEIIFGLTNPQRGEMFKGIYDPSLLPNPVFTPDSVIFNEYMFGSVSPSLSYGGSRDDYRYISQWKNVGNKYYFYKYQDLTDTGLIYNTIVPMLRLGEMYLIAAETAPTEEEQYAWLNKLRSHRGIAAVDSRLDNTLKYEFIRETFGEGQIFFFHKRKYLPILRTLDGNGTPVRVSASNALYVVPLPDTEVNN